MKALKNPHYRVRGAWLLFILSVIGGVYSTVWVAQESYERILMGISWGAIAITAIDVVATTDVRANNKEEE